MMYWNGQWNWGAWMGMTVMMVLFWGAVAWAIVAAVRGSGSSDLPSAPQIVDERLARGEISLDEHQTLHQAIRTGRSTPTTSSPGAMSASTSRAEPS